jgi:hypothetical protein
MFRTIARPSLLAASLLALAVLPAAAQSPSPSASPEPAASANTAPSGSPGLIAPGTARITTTGDVALTIDLPQDASSEFPTGDGSYDLLFKDTALNTLYVTLDISGGVVTSAFVGVGVPGTSIADDTYFADFFRSQCLVSIDELDETVVTGTAACQGLENASSKNPLTVDLTAEFSGVPPLVSPSPEASASPEASPSA